MISKDLQKYFQERVSRLKKVVNYKMTICLELVRLCYQNETPKNEILNLFFKSYGSE